MSPLPSPPPFVHTVKGITMTIDWDFSNPEQDVEVAIVGPDEMQFVLTLWHPLGIDRRAHLTVDRDHADIRSNAVADIAFDTVEQAKEWAEQRFGTRTRRAHGRLV